MVRPWRQAIFVQAFFVEKRLSPLLAADSAWARWWGPHTGSNAHARLPAPVDFGGHTRAQWHQFRLAVTAPVESAPVLEQTLVVVPVRSCEAIRLDCGLWSED